MLKNLFAKRAAPPAIAAGRADEIRLCFHLSRNDFTLDLDIALPGHGITALFGPSGSGKTTCLRCVAGLEKPQSAHLTVNGELWQDSARGIFLPVHTRPLGYVFQGDALFPHLSVKRNLEFGQRRLPATQQQAQPHLLEMLGIAHLLERFPHELSGGERQRVGIARALLASPRLLLMDEPLASLDMARKREILPYLERLHSELAIPVLYVSHAPDEIVRLADHVVLMEKGRVQASGPLQQTLARLDLPMAFDSEASVVIEARISAHDDEFHLSTLRFSGGEVLVNRRPEAIGKALRLRIHARDVSLAKSPAVDSSISNSLPVTVQELADADTPAHLLVKLDVAGTPLLARITRRSAAQLGVAPGEHFYAQIKTVALPD